MKLVKEKILLSELKKMSKRGFGQMVKAAVDVKKEVMVVDGELHADEERLLLENSSKQENVWGINLYPEKEKDWVEFDSMINLRPTLGNNTRGVEDPDLRKKITQIVERLVKR